MENEFDYYLLIQNNSGATPLLKNDDRVDLEGVFYLYRREQAPPGHVNHLTFREPFPLKPNLNTDYLKMDTSAVFSQKIYKVLSQQEIKGLQLVSVVIRGNTDETYPDFFIANIYQERYSFDKERTHFSRISKHTGAWEMIKHIRLDKKILAKVPLEDRLVFASREHPSFILYHKLVVDLLLSVKPKGLSCVPVEEWN